MEKKKFLISFRSGSEPITVAATGVNLVGGWLEIINPELGMWAAYPSDLISSVKQIA